MPFLSVIIILTVAGVISAAENNTPRNTKPFTRSEREQILGEMIGKSKRECRKILKQHRKY